jgi:AraC-like DNA-binding protein
MSRTEADRVHRTEDKRLVVILERHIEDLVEKTAKSDLVKEKVQALIGIYLGHKPITVGALAADLKLSQRSLQRKLAAEGMSLRDLLRQHRQTLAGQYLGDRTVSMSEVARVLGYADSTVLWRALRAWGDS